ncbi:hypothetical protein [Halobacillus seohaensis]|uniref:Uncharacterized protein n=1 Tax=Halobacillus seohaensis TaxID=447421 RepID=A0ABW2ENC3_9BACI
MRSVIQQFSQLMVKSSCTIKSEAGVVCAQNKETFQKDEPMAGVRGDESPLSYLQATVCYYELFKYDKSNQDSWSYERILDDSFIKNLEIVGMWPFEPSRKSLNPIFFYDSLHHPVVIFYTIQGDEEKYIQKHIHRFDCEGYNLKVGTRVFKYIEDSSIPWERMS